MVKNNFETLADNRIEFMKRLALDDELAKCLLNKSTNFKNTTVTQLEKSELMHTQIFPYLKTTSTLLESKSYITMKFRYKKLRGSNVFKVASVTFYVFCDSNIITTPYMIIRPDYMLQQIDRLLNDTRGEGWLGKLSLDGMEDVTMDSDGKYIGLAVTYTDTEFQ